MGFSVKFKKEHPSRRKMSFYQGLTSIAVAAALALTGCQRERVYENENGRDVIEMRTFLGRLVERRIENPYTGEVTIKKYDGKIMREECYVDGNLEYVDIQESK